ncbi:MAG: helix-turn-helix domain-containing protein [Corynebacteriales bacterium]|nr:helix-turn-helix domain-containing protein [Mycobacteriales bacterium]
MVRVSLAVTNGVPLFELAAPIAIFGTPEPEATLPWYEFTLGGPPQAHVGGWFRAEPTHGLDELAKADTVIVPACHDGDMRPPKALVEAIRAAYDNGARIASICTGAFVLAAAGILDGKAATTHWMHSALLADRHPKIQVNPEILYIGDGQVFTSAGKASGIDLCLHLVRLDHGASVANAIARRLVVAPHRPGGQAQFMTAPVPHRDLEGLSDVLSWALTHLEQNLTVDDLAHQANMSARQLTRRFRSSTGTTPMNWLLAQRMNRAKELLERTDNTVERIAERAGMGSAATLRRHFHRTIGVPPETYRRAFREAA